MMASISVIWRWCVAWPAARKRVDTPLQKSNLRSGERMVEVNPDGKEALTLFKVLRRFGEFAACASQTLSPVAPIRFVCMRYMQAMLLRATVNTGDEDFGQRNPRYRR